MQQIWVYIHPDNLNVKKLILFIKIKYALNII